ncbi:hypothetical protein PTI98_003016 [Pleurotus ostreatus]|nr:hypothetical protein PTI98_003016 [Pleurotus ostreatus]
MMTPTTRLRTDGRTGGLENDERMDDYNKIPTKEQERNATKWFRVHAILLFCKCFPAIYLKKQQNVYIPPAMLHSVDADVDVER